MYRTVAAWIALLSSLPCLAQDKEWLNIDRPAEQAICFSLYTVHNGTMKMTVQLYPLADDVSRKADLQIERNGRWVTMARVLVDDSSYGGPLEDFGRWTAHFRLNDWDHSRDWNYRVVAAEGKATYEGVIRRDPIDKPEIVVASLSCNSNEDHGPRQDIVDNLLAQDPDLLFFAGDQVYDHTKHLQSWLAFGRQFGELTRNRPTVTIPDDHDVGQGNLWGEGGVRSYESGGDDGGYIMDPRYVNSVQLAQAWHLPDPYDPTPIHQDIGVYYTSLRVGGVDFAIIEDRKFKTGPKGALTPLKRKAGRVDEVTAEQAFDPKRVDIPEAELLGDRQIEFLRHWGQDWSNAEMKAVLSQTIFGHIGQLSGPWIGPGGKDFNPEAGGKLLMDFDSNGWPQTGRNEALAEIRRCFAVMLCGDQHLPTVVHLGINDFRDAGVSFASPAIMNVWPRRWSPFSERLAGDDPDPLIGDYIDGFGNKLSMMAYANASVQPRRDDPSTYGGLAEGYGLIRFNTAERTITMECWPRWVDVTATDAWQYKHWPVVTTQDEQYAREPIAFLPDIHVMGADNPVVQVIHASSGELLYTKRWRGNVVSPHTFLEGEHIVRVGEQPGLMVELTGLMSSRIKDDRVVHANLINGAKPWPTGTLLERD